MGTGDLKRAVTLVLSFDEMSVKSEVVYDRSSGLTLGPHRQAQVCRPMLCGLVDNWKQPIFYNFDVSITAVLFHKMISVIDFLVMFLWPLYAILAQVI